MEKEFAAGGVVLRNENGIEVLLIKDKYGYCTWPKGHIEALESPEEAALREIFEETNQSDTKIIEKLGEQKYNCIVDGKEIFKTVYVFLVEVLSASPIVVQSEEIKSAEWMRAETALEKIEYDGSKELLQYGIDLYKGIING